MVPEVARTSREHQGAKKQLPARGHRPWPRTPPRCWYTAGGRSPLVPSPAQGGEPFQGSPSNIKRADFWWSGSCFHVMYMGYACSHRPNQTSWYTLEGMFDGSPGGGGEGGARQKELGTRLRDLDFLHPLSLTMSLLVVTVCSWRSKIFIAHCTVDQTVPWLIPMPAAGEIAAW